MMLRTQNLSYRVNSAVIVDSVSAKAAQGDLIGLVGPNGAGKSTFANLITGFNFPSSGDIYFNGQSIRGLAPERVARLGVGRTFQTAHLPWNLTLHECLAAAVTAAASHAHSLQSWTADISANKASFIRQLADKLGLDELDDLPVRNLSFGQQRMLGLAIALAMPSRLLILDEPFTGLKGAALGKIVPVLHDEAKRRAIIVIDHTLSVVREVATRIWYMNKGRLSEFRDFDELAASEDFKKNYLGSSSQRPKLPRPAYRATARVSNLAPVLSLKSIAAGYGSNIVVRDASLSLYPGDVVCVIGLNGSGKSTILRAVMGLARRFRGDMALFGERLPRPLPNRVTNRGVRLLVQDQRLFRTLTLRDNILVSVAGLPSGIGLRLSSARRRADLRRTVEQTLRELESGGIEGADRLASTFSGGEQARIALAQIQLLDPRLILLDEPTSGLDGASVETLRDKIQIWQQRGIPMLIVEHALDFVATVATRVLVLAQGRLFEIELTADTTGQNLLGKLLSISSADQGDTNT